jgi:hypothetical protein
MKNIQSHLRSTSPAAIAGPYVQKERLVWTINAGTTKNYIINFIMPEMEMIDSAVKSVKTAGREGVFSFE